MQDARSEDGKGSLSHRNISVVNTTHIIVCKTQLSKPLVVVPKPMVGWFFWGGGKGNLGLPAAGVAASVFIHMLAEAGMAKAASCQHNDTFPRLTGGGGTIVTHFLK